MSLQTDLDVFFTEHMRCGDLDAGVEGPMVWIACELRREDRAEGQRGRGVGRSRTTSPSWLTR